MRTQTEKLKQFSSLHTGGALGFGDGETLPLDVVLAHAARIVASGDLPVSVDFEAGYAATADGMAGNVGRLVAAGIYLEDGYPAGDGEGLRPVEDVVGRLKAARGGRCGAARFLDQSAHGHLPAAEPETHGTKIAEVIACGRACAEAGASSFFVPGLHNLESIRQVCAASPLPVNVMARPACGA
jgi:2-methylisocitrate lyase-like PEP mutase family enzyme